MHRKNYFVKRQVSASINKLHFMLPIFFAILISTFYALFVLLSDPISQSSLSLFEGINEYFIAVNIIMILILSIMGLAVFFHFFKKSRRFSLKILVASFILGGVLSTLLFGKLAFTLLGLESPLLLIVVAVVAYIGSYLAYLVLVDALSGRMKNMLFVICSGALGSFLGVLLPVISVIGILIFLSFLDFVLIKKKTVEKIVGEENYEKLVLDVTFSNEDWGIGIGDLTCYGMVVSNTLTHLGILAGALSLLFILFGSFLSLVLLFRFIRIPGLPIAVILGLLPSITMLLF